MADHTKGHEEQETAAAAISAAEQAAASIAAVQMQLTTGTASGEPLLATTVLDRLGVQRRVLGFVTDDIDKDALGARNTLPALTYALMRDRNTTHPPSTHGRLEVDGLTVAQIAQNVLDILDELIGVGLVAQRADGSYEVTEAGQVELAT